MTFIQTYVSLCFATYHISHEDMMGVKAMSAQVYFLQLKLGWAGTALAAKAIRDPLFTWTDGSLG